MKVTAFEKFSYWVSSDCSVSLPDKSQWRVDGQLDRGDCATSPE
jgi:hypothetical protein